MHATYVSGCKENPIITSPLSIGLAMLICTQQMNWRGLDFETVAYGNSGNPTPLSAKFWQQRRKSYTQPKLFFSLSSTSGTEKTACIFLACQQAARRGKGAQHTKTGHNAKGGTLIYTATQETPDFRQENLNANTNAVPTHSTLLIHCTTTLLHRRNGLFCDVLGDFSWKGISSTSFSSEGSARPLRLAGG